MPTPILPPTPAASTDIAAQEKSWPSSSSPESSLALPPPALQSATEHGPLSPSAVNTKTTCPPDSANGRPLGRSTFIGTKKLRPVPEAKPFTLPSPPTRSRKIIQMKPPRPQPETQPSSKRRKTGPGSTLDPSSTQKSSSSSSSSSNHVNNVSKPTKKAIRKTAHSLIERRRRSKMNDAFSTLKEMIPACRGGDERDGSGKEMHKLDVLNAGIEYLAYLERCLERMNKRQWEGKGTAWSSQIKAIEVDDEEEIGDSTDNRGLVSMGRQHKGQSEQQYHLGQDKDEEVETQKKSPLAPLSACRCDCKSHSRTAHENDPKTTLRPSPAPPTPSLDPRLQTHLSPQLSCHSEPVRDRDRARDSEETTNTAAALLMLTSTDRRGNSTADSRPRPSFHPTIATANWETYTPSWEAQTQRLTIKTGLSVRDLLLK